MARILRGGKQVIIVVLRHSTLPGHLGVVVEHVHGEACTEVSHGLMTDLRLRFDIISDLPTCRSHHDLLSNISFSCASFCLFGGLNNGSRFFLKSLAATTLLLKL